MITEKFNIIIFFLVFILTVSIVAPFWSRERLISRKLVFFFLSLTLLVYSGMGIAMLVEWKRYLFMYMFYLFTICLTLHWTWRIRLRHRTISPFFFLHKGLDPYSKYEIIFELFSWIFIMTIFIHLFIPIFRLNLFFSPPAPSLIDIFANRSLKRLNPILKIADTINIFLLPFFLIYQYLLIEKGHKFQAFIWIGMWFYLDYLKFGYWGRNDFLTNGLFLLMVFFSMKDGELRINKIQIVTLLLILIFVTPLLLIYESYRIGASFHVDSLFSAFTVLLLKETDYPKYYSAIEVGFDGSLISSFIGWILSLPIPSMLWRGKPTIDINGIFTSNILDLQRGDSGFYIILPSILGEGILIFGSRLYWLTGVILAFFIGFFTRLFEKRKAFCLINLYNIVMLLVVGRAGLQSYLPLLINSNLLTILVFLILNSYKRKVRHKL